MKYVLVVVAPSSSGFTIGQIGEMIGACPRSPARGRAWCETDAEATDLETVIQNLLDGQYSDPIRVVSFGEGSSRDISADVAEELRPRWELEMREIPSSLEGFFVRHETLRRQLTLRLV